MSKKMMLLALAVASMAMFALPAVASAQEDHIDGITNFTGTNDPGSLVPNSSEPSISCTNGNGNAGVTGTISAGGTTGSITLDFVGCTAKTIFGNVNCNTKGAGTGTIASSGTTHTITFNSKPAILVTAVTTEVICAGISNTHVEGSVIGTITSPACNTNSTTMTVKFEATANVQNHLEYTGVKYQLLSKTPGGKAEPAGLNATATLTSTTAGKVTCT